MKVLYVLDSLNRGGAEILALDVCRNAGRHGIELTLAATGRGALEEEFRGSGVEFVSIPRKLPVDPVVIAKLRSLIRSGGFEVVHAYQAVEALHAWLASVGTGVKRVLTFHGHIPDAKNRSTLQFLIPRMDANIVIGEAMKRSLIDDDHLDLDHNLHLVYNGVDTGRLDRPQRDVREELGLAPNSLLLGMVANFYSAPRKDQRTVCRALPTVFASVPDAHFVFVYSDREDADKAKLEECKHLCEASGIASRVHFLGSAIPALEVVRALDVFVLSSLHEGLPISVTEAMLMGKPCILSDIAPLIEISDNGRYAILFKTGEAEDLAEKAILLLGDADRRLQLGAAGKTWASERFSIDAHLNSLMMLYQRVAA